MRSDSPEVSRTRDEAVDRVRQSLERWRSTRKHLSPIPPALWSAAVELARECGLAPTARALRLDYNGLKKRLGAWDNGQAGSPAPAPRFIELIATPAGPAGECTIELEHPAGARMRIHYAGGAMPDLAALGRAFWSTGA